jgi:hypothetical protein
MFNENKSRNSGGGTFPDSGSALFYSASLASFSSSLTRHTLSNGNTSISLKTNNRCVAHSTLLSDAAASAFQVAAAPHCSLSSAFPTHPRLEPLRSDVLASGFPRVHRAQSPGAALRDVDPSAIREVVFLFIPSRNAYPEAAAHTLGCKCFETQVLP